MTAARLDWVTRGQDDEPYWELVLTVGKTLTVFGRLYIAQLGYVIIIPGSGPHTAIQLGDLTLDEAKSAAKLVLMTGGRQ